MKFCRRENFNEQVHENVPDYDHDALYININISHCDL